jgi:hypothetical protein
MAIYGPITTPAAAGGAGVAAATGYSTQVVRGFLVGIDIQYNDAPPAATTDVGIKTKGASGILPSRNLLVITNAATDGYFVPQAPGVTAANVATGQYAAPYVEDVIQLDIAGANAGDSVTIWLYTVN